VNVTANGSANLETIARMMGSAEGSAGMRGAASAGRSGSSAMSGVGAMPEFGAMLSISTIPSFSELMLQSGAMARARAQISVVGDGRDGVGAEKLDVETATAGEEGGKLRDGIGLPAFCPFSAKAEVANAATGAMIGGAALVGSTPGSGSGVRASLAAPRVNAGITVAQRREAKAIVNRAPTKQHAGVSNLSKPAEAAITRRPVAATTVVEPNPVTTSRAIPVGHAAASPAETARVVSARDGEAVAATDKEANPESSGAPAGSGATRSATSAQVAATPALARDLQPVEGHVAEAKSLPKSVASVNGGEQSITEPGAMGRGARTVRETGVSTAGAITKRAALESIGAHGDAGGAYAVMLAGKAVSVAGLVTANPVEFGAGNSLLHGANTGAIAQPVIANAGTNIGVGATHATAGGNFARMDSAAPPLVTESSPQRLAVGVRDAGLGWVEIRTHAAGGQVSAVLTAASSEAQATLNARLPEVREYLAGQQVRVDQLSSELLSPGDREGSSGGQAGNAQAGNAQGGSAQAGSARAGNSEKLEQGSVAAMFAGDGESLSYINVRV
jgi:hypothetical protein